MFYQRYLTEEERKKVKEEKRKESEIKGYNSDLKEKIRRRRNGNRKR